MTRCGCRQWLSYVTESRRGLARGGRGPRGEGVRGVRVVEGSYCHNALYLHMQLTKGGVHLFVFDLFV